MGSIKIKIHPLTFALAFYYALSGKIGVFIVYTITALVHEIGHSFCADKRGYYLGKICLMPFGAVVSGNQSDFTAIDQIKIALAGPIINLMVGVFFIALWWVFPETYPFTDLIVEANLTLALINFLPAYPLDGGRVLHGLLSMTLKPKTAEIICKIIGVIFSLLLFTLFIFTCFNSVNISLLFFALFVLVGALSKEKGNAYIRIAVFPNLERMKKGVKINRVGVDKSLSVRGLLTVVDSSKINEVVVFDGDKELKVLSQKELAKIIETGNLSSNLGSFLFKT